MARCIVKIEAHRIFIRSISSGVTIPIAQAKDIYEAVAEQVRAGAEGCDAVLLETFTDLYELKASLLAVKDHCTLPVFATMSFEG